MSYVYEPCPCERGRVDGPLVGELGMPRAGRGCPGGEHTLPRVAVARSVMDRHERRTFRLACIALHSSGSIPVRLVCEPNGEDA